MHSIFFQSKLDKSTKIASQLQRFLGAPGMQLDSTGADGEAVPGHGRPTDPKGLPSMDYMRNDWKSSHHYGSKQAGQPFWG